MTRWSEADLRKLQQPAGTPSKPKKQKIPKPDDDADRGGFNCTRQDYERRNNEVMDQTEIVVTDDGGKAVVIFWRRK